MLIVAGVVISYLALRRLPVLAPAPVPVPAAEGGGADWCPVLRCPVLRWPVLRWPVLGLAVPSWRAAGHSPRLIRLAASSCQPGPGLALSTHQVAPAAT